MANSVNKVIIIGNLGADPEVRSLGSGAQVASIRVACTERWKDQSGQKQEKTEWITCIGWRHHAELLQKYTRKGDRIYIEGKLQTRSWEDKNGGGKRYATEVMIREITFLSAPSEGGHQGGHSSHGSSYGGGYQSRGPVSSGDDLPDFGETTPLPPDPGNRAPDDDLPFNFDDLP